MRVRRKGFPSPRARWHDMRLLPLLPLAIGLICGCNREPFVSPSLPTPAGPTTPEEFMELFSRAWDNRDSTLLSGLLNTPFILEFPEYEPDYIPPNFWTREQTETNVSAFFSKIDSTKLSFSYELIDSLEVSVHVDSILVCTASSGCSWSSGGDWVLFLTHGSAAEDPRVLYLSYWIAPYYFGCLIWTVAHS